MAVNKSLEEKGLLDADVEVIDDLRDEIDEPSLVKPSKTRRSELAKMMIDSATNHVSTTALTLGQTAAEKIKVEELNMESET